MSNESGAILRLLGIRKSFGPVQAIKNMQLHVQSGRVHTILGENGAGKSTLMKILVGVYAPTEGQMWLDDQIYAPDSPRAAADRGVAIIFQELSLCNNLTVAENILATVEPKRFGLIDQKALFAQAARIVSDLGLPIDVRAKVADLSIAQRQLVEIAKGLRKPAKVVIFDEPTSSLSDNEAEILFGLIARLKARGTAVLYISHRMEEIMRISDDITVVRDGEYITTKARHETTIDALIALMVGRDMANYYPPRIEPANSASATPRLAVKGLSRADEFSDINFDVGAGEILGFFGLVGSGRSEVMNGIFGMKRVDGRIALDGQVVQLRSAPEAIAAGIGFVTENRKEEGLVLGHSLRLNVTMAALPTFSRKGFVQAARERDTALAEIERLGIRAHSIDTIVNTLSGGNQQKIVFAKWLQTKPKVLILDEPTRGVDVGAKYEIYRVIRELAAHGTAVLLISSELPEVLGMSDRVVVMAEGRITATLGGQEMTPETVMAFATGSH